MNFEIGKEYIVRVYDSRIIPVEEFDRNRWFNKDYDDLDFLTDEEKIVVINDVLDKIRAELESAEKKWWYGVNDDCFMKLSDVLQIIDKYRKVDKE